MDPLPIITGLLCGSYIGIMLAVARGWRNHTTDSDGKPRPAWLVAYRIIFWPVSKATDFSERWEQCRKLDAELWKSAEDARARRAGSGP